MKIFGKTFSEYVGFQKIYLILILVVGLTRLGLSLLGMPDSTVKYFSLTVLSLFGLLYYSVHVYTSGFGSYKQLLPVLIIQSLVGGSIVVGGIVLSIFTDKGNIFSAPEYSPTPALGRTWLHAGAHVVAMIVAPIVFWLLGCLIMFITKKVIGPRAAGSSAAAA